MIASGNRFTAMVKTIACRIESIMMTSSLYLPKTQQNVWRPEKAILNTIRNVKMLIVSWMDNYSDLIAAIGSDSDDEDDPAGEGDDWDDDSTSSAEFSLDGSKVGSIARGIPCIASLWWNVERCVFDLQGDYTFVSRVATSCDRAVYRAIRKADGVDVAVRFTSSVSELRIMSYLKGLPNVESAITTYMGTRLNAVVSRWHNSLPLPAAITSHAALVDIATQLLTALVGLHSRGIVHRDIKLSNLLWDGCELVLIDFDLAGAGQCNARMIGTDGFMAPEVQRDGARYGAEVDIFSAGVVLHSIAMQKKEGDVDAPYVLPHAMNGCREFVIMLDAMLSTDPLARPSALECLSMLTDMAQSNTVDTPVVDGDMVE